MFGAGGAIGRRIVLEALERAHDVTAVHRKPPASQDGLRVVGRFRTGRDRLLSDDQGRSRITIEDYAAALLEELERPQAIGRRMTAAY